MIDDDIVIETLHRDNLATQLEDHCRVAQLMERSINALQATARKDDEATLMLLADSAMALGRDLRNMVTKLQDDAVKLQD
jgi:hypothetical protein